MLKVHSEREGMTFGKKYSVERFCRRIDTACMKMAMFVTYHIRYDSTLESLMHNYYYTQEIANSKSTEAHTRSTYILTH